MNGTNDGPLSDEEFDTLLALLRRVCEYELDQFLLWKFPTPFGETFVTIAREPALGSSGDGYNRVPQP
ncbi:hypothetical protein [Herbidospora mongoliensis]|uniref:hypothetical protein n=1 Tax=Herbidospora mongoliensis TaxID=688067 RepID=UPI000835A396|nr:hypothetical protein [Herbidospora mongoliensis]